MKRVNTGSKLEPSLPDEWEITKAATCNEPGSRTKNCIHCEGKTGKEHGIHTITEVIPATGLHQPKASNCHECNVCGSPLPASCTKENPCTLHKPAAPQPKPPAPSGPSNQPPTGAPPAPPSFGSGATANWNNLDKDLSNKSGVYNHVVNSGNDIVVPDKIINTLKGTSGTVMFKTGKVTFSLSGGNIPAVSDNLNLDLSLRKGGLNAPANKMAEVSAGAITTVEIPMVSKESFGMAVGIHFNFGAVNSGKFANLYRFNEESGQFEYLGSFEINDKGQAMFGINGGADYLVTVTNQAPNLPIVLTTNMASYTVRPGDTLARIASRHGMTLRQILNLNPQITNPNRIRVGQVIRLR